jgi:Carboxypeptidase regulatory-like domain
MPLKGFYFRSLIKAITAVVILACGISVCAQVTTGTVRGVVTDQTGAVVPGATVTITDPTKKTSQSVQSGSGGEYQFNNLLVGTYVITVQSPPQANFSTLTINDVRVKLNEVTEVPTVLQPGEATAFVTGFVQRFQSPAIRARID